MNKKIALLGLITTLVVSQSSFAMLLVQDATAIGNQILQLSDSGSTLNNIIKSTQEGVRLAQSTYKGFKKLTDANGNLYDAYSAIMESGMDIAGQGMKFAQSISREDMDWETFNLINSLVDAGSDLIQATEYNVNYATTGEGWIPSGHFNENTGEWSWDNNYNVKIPSSYDIKKTYSNLSRLVSKTKDKFQEKLDSLADEKQKVINSANKAIENTKDAGEDLSSNAAVQSAIQSANIALKSLEEAEANLKYAQQKQLEQQEQLFEKKATQEFIGSLNDEILAMDEEIQAKQRRIEALQKLNKQNKRSK